MNIYVCLLVLCSSCTQWNLLWKISHIVDFNRSLKILLSLTPGGIIVLYLCAQFAVLYTYNCLPIMIYFRLGQNQLIKIKYAVRSSTVYSFRPLQLEGLTYIITLCTITSLLYTSELLKTRQRTKFWSKQKG